MMRRLRSVYRKRGRIREWVVAKKSERANARVTEPTKDPGTGTDARPIELPLLVGRSAFFTHHISPSLLLNKIASFLGTHHRHQPSSSKVGSGGTALRGEAGPVQKEQGVRGRSRHPRLRVAAAKVILWC